MKDRVEPEIDKDGFTEVAKGAGTIFKYGWTPELLSRDSKSGTSNGCIDGWSDGCSDRLIDGSDDGSSDGYIDGLIHDGFDDMAVLMIS